MEILFLADNYPPETNAAALRVHERAKYWVRWGHKVTVLTSAPNFPEGVVHPGYRNRWRHEEEMDGVRVIRVKTFIAPNKGVYLRIADFMSFMATAFIRGLFLKRPDVVVATSPQFFCAVGGCALAKVKRRPFVFELSDLWPASIRAVGAMRNRRLLGMVERLELSTYRRSDRIIALTDAFREDLVARGINRSKIDVVQNGAETDFLTPGPADEALREQLGLTGKFVVAYIGTQGMAHALDNVLEAALRLRGEPVAFLLVGSGAAHEELRAQASGMQLENVVFVLRRPREEIAEYWRLADVALVHLKDDPVFSTVLPSKIFEAMAMGLPVLYAGPYGEASRLIEREGAGVCVPAGDPDALAAAVSNLAAYPDRRREFARRSAAAAPRHTRQSQAERFLTCLQNVVEPVPARALVEAPDPLSREAEVVAGS